MPYLLAQGKNILLTWEEKTATIACIMKLNTQNLSSFVDGGKESLNKEGLYNPSQSPLKKGRGGSPFSKGGARGIKLPAFDARKS